jgi:hypothetical protein
MRRVCMLEGYQNGENNKDEKIHSLFPDIFPSSRKCAVVVITCVSGL